MQEKKYEFGNKYPFGVSNQINPKPITPVASSKNQASPGARIRAPWYARLRSTFLYYRVTRMAIYLFPLNAKQTARSPRTARKLFNRKPVSLSTGSLLCYTEQPLQLSFPPPRGIIPFQRQVHVFRIAFLPNARLYGNCRYREAASHRQNYC